MRNKTLKPFKPGDRGIQWGIIGGGSVVEKNSISFNRIPQSNLQAIFRRDIAVATETAHRLGAKASYSSVTELLADPDVNTVCIATPPGLHLEQAILCADAKKPTYIEKPLARNYTEALRIVKAFEESGTPLFVGHYRRALRRFQHLKEVLDDGIIGKAIEIDFRMCRQYPPDPKKEPQGWIYDPKFSGGGKFIDIAPHTIDLLIYLFGNFSSINSRAINSTITPRVEDVVVFTFNTDSGAVGTANFNMASAEKSDQLIISGTKGVIKLSVHGDEPIKISGEHSESEITDSIPNPIEEPMIANVVYSLLGKELPLCSGQDALPTMKVIDEVLDEYYGGRSDDFWNRPASWSRRGAEKISN
ncbi:hypothetical protein A3H83_04020 [Candidatus Roizmanbacteria bacterium RIFCSPLOWO2_02_FULL_39_8]|uniref:Oxidoreductase n=1 Tax=Candidatus Roizmanbacteria bacterium RIFCSPHIGHO2_01_FULL_39_24 TaxID=1802032 RepID=A0A1F7GIQ9_9BACT|nr:MAG: hypothetical protein A2799_03895 [Candidatus Roizmanbacteria bacterium RIFCSPHIGHO2_01_FULL_39_24]OGK56549.1 MAG: hypothetical protein A3H83_04020 [Candidatus Roizmanbacteria bacterium RIFCSPLOWO2_02_FULL_39_8]